MAKARIEIPGEPIAWKRPVDKSYGGKHWRFDSQKQEKEVVRSRLHLEYGKNRARWSLFGDREAIAIHLTFYLPINRSDSHGAVNAKLWDIQAANEKPDADNLAKFYLDCINGIFWSDDKRVNELHVKKKYSEKPRTIIEIMTKNNLNLPPNIEGILSVFGPNELKEFAKHVKRMSYLTEEAIEDSLGKDDREAHGRWLAWTALLLSKFAIEHADNLKKILKYKDLDQDIKEMQLEVVNEKERH